MYTAEIFKDGKRIISDFEHGATVADIISSAAVPVRLGCGGRGSCGKCRVRISGEISQPSDSEKKHLSQEELLSGVRLACRTKCFGNVKIYLYGTEYSPKNGDLPDMTVTKPLTGEKRCTVGVVDIGTTTVHGYNVSMPEGRIISGFCVENPQRVHGSDVISRLTFASAGGTARLRSEIRNCIKENCPDADFFVLTGNTVMLHFYFGLDTSGFEGYPFEPETLFGGIYEGNTFVMPCISAFIGADTLCAVSAVDLPGYRCALMTDLGTNGETVLFRDGRFYACSTAAGPVFEGGGISCGMPYSPGAVDRVWFERGKMKYSVVGDSEPVGLCGTGVISAVSSMISCGAVSETGFLPEPFRIGNSPVSITQEDIQSVLLAKAAVRAGIETLFAESGTKAEQIGAFFLAGSLGSSVSVRDAVITGLIPPLSAKRASAAGNAALHGALGFLFDSDRLEAAIKLIPEVKVIELSGNPGFEKIFVENMKFDI